METADAHVPRTLTCTYMHTYGRSTTDPLPVLPARRSAAPIMASRRRQAPEQALSSAAVPVASSASAAS
ncbi:hypothetical protein CMS0982 [Clavibacter sepedonicus]|uniref:Uncharacterized protein n=1 Tax=Clavibacter sepedonicus TaxID=31964 RepID=B0RFV9_CLASE|nr:hypothetical protein CMS0982 [Clavibacter sepedonicus]